jgi:DNA-binding MarR family transcriptional regulator
MGVKPISLKEHMSPTQDGSFDAEVRELMGDVRQVFTALKHGGPVPAPFQEAFERASLGPRHVGSIMTVTLEGALSVSELAEHLGLSLSTTSLMVGELSRAGLLERAEDENDRRRTIVKLNEQYREEMDAWLRERLDPFLRTLERLSPRARANFIEGWRILAEESSRIVRSDAHCEPG